MSQSVPFEALDTWFETPAGLHVMHACIAELSAFTDHAFGDVFLQLGQCGPNLWLENFRYNYRWLCHPLMKANNDIVADFDRIPCDRDSIDCVLAPMTIEAFSQRMLPLDEIDRVLKPMGYAVFIGVNPLGLMGLSSKLRLWNCFGNQRPHLTSAYFISKALLSRGYRQCQLSTFYYLPPVKTRKWLERCSFFNSVGNMLWPFPAGFYCLVVQKMDYTLTPLVADKVPEFFVPINRSLAGAQIQPNEGGLDV